MRHINIHPPLTHNADLSVVLCKDVIARVPFACEIVLERPNRLGKVINGSSFKGFLKFFDGETSENEMIERRKQVVTLFGKKGIPLGDGRRIELKSFNELHVTGHSILMN